MKSDLCRRIHETVEPLPLFNKLTPRPMLPKNGIYFFYEKGEFSLETGKERIVRVGTHKSHNGFRKRIYSHFMGNKNGSVFRKHLGSALMRREGQNGGRLKQWLGQDTPTFKDVENKVSAHLGENFSFRCIAVDNVQERLDLEERLIATLAYCPSCKPSKAWLGQFAANPKIRLCGLWNDQHVNSDNIVTDQHLSRLAQLVKEDLARQH